jgi:ribosomal protein S15
VLVGVSRAKYRGIGTDQSKVAQFQRAEADTGSTEVQIARISARVEQLTGHLQQHRKDYAATRGLTILLGQRRRLMRYLYQQNRCAVGAGWTERALCGTSTGLIRTWFGIFAGRSPRGYSSKDGWVVFGRTYMTCRCKMGLNLLTALTLLKAVLGWRGLLDGM